MVDCREIGAELLDYQRDRLAPDARARVERHLGSCAACARLDARERALTELLERRLPQHPASPALKRRLGAAWATEAPARRGWWRGERPWLVPALAAGLVLTLAAPAVLPWFGWHRDRTDRLVTEAVNDHVRMLVSQHPLDVEAGGLHQVKPWLTERLDFAPVVNFEGSPEFPLEGGAVGYFIDRRAAVFVYRRRLHRISLLIVKAEGLSWPGQGGSPLARVAPYRTTARGFNVLMWREGELGYALVSDLDAGELGELATKLGRRS